MLFILSCSMEKELIVKQLEEDNQLNLEELGLTDKDYEKLKQNWLKKRYRNF